MEAFTARSVGGRLGLPFPSPPRLSRRSLSCRRRRSSRVLALRDGPELDKWDQMELKFGRLLGEDPNLTLAKIMARKSDPDASYLEVEKEYNKKKGKLAKKFASLPPDDVNLEGPEKLSLSRPPVMKKGVKASSPGLNTKPSLPEVQRDRSLESIHAKGGGVSNVALRRPASVQADDIDTDRMKVKPNLYLKTRWKSSESVSDVTLLKKPEVVKISSSDDQANVSHEGIKTPPDDVKLSVADKERMVDGLHESATEGEQDGDNGGVPTMAQLHDGPKRGSELPNQLDVEPTSELQDENNDHSDGSASTQSALLAKPQRMGSSVKEVPRPTGTEKSSLNNEGDSYAAEIDHFVSKEQEEREDNDWKRVEHLLQTGGRDEVELISCSGRGFVVSFGSLIGFLPYRNLGAKWKFLAFESWLRRKGLDPSKYRQNLSIVGSYDAQSKNLSRDYNENQDMGQKDNETFSPNVKFEDLMDAYDQEKTKFLSSFVGQRIRVSVILADRKLRKLIFSGRPKEKEEVVEKKRNLMAKLSVGDVVKCCITKITYFGIFVEVEGVPALIHQSEVSWDATIDPSSYYSIGQIVEAKVHQLDYALERITLSLKEITPDPLMEALESVVGERTSLGGSLEAAQADVEWADVELLIKELQQIDGINDVSKGRFFLSPGLAPTFQVYMASMFGNEYKLLARYGNKVQEVIVQASLDKEQMRSAILTCTNKVE